MNQQPQILPINCYSLSDFAQAIHDGTLQGYTLDHHSNDNACIQLGILFTCKMVKRVEYEVVKKVAPSVTLPVEPEDAVSALQPPVERKEPDGLVENTSQETSVSSHTKTKQAKLKQKQ